MFCKDMLHSELLATDISDIQRQKAIVDLAASLPLVGGVHVQTCSQYCTAILSDLPLTVPASID